MTHVVATTPALAEASQFTVIDRQLTRANFGLHYERTPYFPDGTFANDNLKAGTTAFGVARLFYPGFSEIWNGTTINEPKLQFLLNEIAYWRSKNASCIWTMGLMPYGTNVYLGNDVTNPTQMLAHLTLIRAGLTAIFSRVDVQAAVAAGFAVTPQNEPVECGSIGSATWASGWATTGTNGASRLAQLQRVVYLTIKPLCPVIKIGTCDFQGGEHFEWQGMLGASAAGITIDGSTGSDTVGAGFQNQQGNLFFNAACWHPYGQDTLTSDVLGTVNRLTQHIAVLGMGSLRAGLELYARHVGTSPLYGMDIDAIPKWATEFNVCAVSNPSETQFKFQVATSPQKTSLMETNFAAGINAGFELLVLFLADGDLTYGPQNFGVTGAAIGAAKPGGGNYIRLTATEALGLFQNGDDIFIHAAPAGATAEVGTTRQVSVISSGGGALTFDLVGSTWNGSATPNGTWHMTAHRDTLSGWVSEAAAVIAAMTGSRYSGGFLYDQSGDPVRPFYKAEAQPFGRESFNNAFRDFS